MLTILVTEPTILSNKLDCHAQIHCISFLCCCPPPQWFLYFYPEGYMLRNGGGGRCKSYRKQDGQQSLCL